MKRILVFLGLMLLWAGVIGFACYGTSVSMDRIENPFAQPRYVWLITFAVLVFCYTVKKEFWKIAGKIAAKWVVVLCCVLMPAVGMAENVILCDICKVTVKDIKPYRTLEVHPYTIWLGDFGKFWVKGFSLSTSFGWDDAAFCKPCFIDLIQKWLNEENKEATK